MKISKIRISSILGIDELEFSPGGTLTEITGGNGTGKTSILEAIKGAVRGGHDATLLSKGAERGEVVLVLDDDAQTQIRKTITKDGSNTAVYRDDKQIPKPASVLKSLLDMMSVNPVDFLSAPPKDRMKVLLESMPIDVDMARLTKITKVRLGPEHQHMHGLAVLDYVQRQVFDDRTGTKRAVEEKEGTINQLTLSLPDVPAGVEGNEDDMREHLEAARKAKEAEEARIDKKWSELQAATQATIDKLKADGQAEIDAIRARVDKAINDEKDRLAATGQRANQQRQVTQDEFFKKATPINVALSTIVANRNAFAKREQAQVTIRQMEEQAEELRQDVETQNRALNDLHAYKTELLANLPIPGLEVVDGEVLRHGIKFDRLNTAQQVDIAIEIAKLRAGDMAICCVDRFEALDPQTLEEFRVRAAQSNLQLFVTRVESGPIKLSMQ